jgi:GT2 family glycosyltransferase
VTTRRRAGTVDVIVPVFNGASTLGEQLHALQLQTYDGDMNVTVVDNMSTDSSATVARSFGMPVVEAHGHQSVAHARNVAMEQTYGDLVLFVDADDVVESTYVARMVDAAASYGLVGGRPITDRAEFARLSPCRPRSHSALHRPVEPFWRFEYVEGCTIGVWRDVAESVGPFDGEIRYYEDVDFSLRAWRGGHALGRCDAALYYRTRARPREIFRQQVRYGRSSVGVYAKHRSHGMTRRPTPVIVNRWGYWILRAPRAVVDSDTRADFARNIGKNVGHLVGSARSHVWYP